jgi:hypothetical protein
MPTIHPITMETIMQLAQVEGAAGVIKDVGESHGFAAVVAVLLMFAFGYVGRAMIGIWQSGEDRKTVAFEKSQDRIAAAQEKQSDAQTASYQKHTEVADATVIAVQTMAEANQRVASAIEILSVSGANEGKILHDVNKRTEKIYQALRGIVKAGVIAASEWPDISRQLEMVDRELDNRTDT